MQMQILCVYRPYKESISKEMNDGDSNLHIALPNCWAGFATATASNTMRCTKKGLQSEKFANAESVQCFQQISVILGSLALNVVFSTKL